MVARIHDLPADGRPYHRRPRWAAPCAGICYREYGWSQARRVRADALLPRPRREESRQARQGEVIMQAKAINRMIRISPNKVRPVIDLVRGKDVQRALSILRYMPQKAAKEIARTIQSAAANAENNFEMEPADLIVKTIYADEGPAFKRFMPRARGRADHIRKRTTHITVIVDD